MISNSETEYLEGLEYVKLQDVNCAICKLYNDCERAKALCVQRERSLQGPPSKTTPTNPTKLPLQLRRAASTGKRYNSPKSAAPRLGLAPPRQGCHRSAIYCGIGGDWMSVSRVALGARFWRAVLARSFGARFWRAVGVRP